MKIHRTIKWGPILAALLFARISAAADLSLDDYLGQVRMRNPAVLSADEGVQAGTERASDASLLLSPTLFANAQVGSDAKPPLIPIYSYESITTDIYSLGVSQLTTFGLQAKLHFDVTYTNFVNLNIPPEGPYALPPIYQAQPVIELTQSLWSNGFGRATRANESLIEAQALSSSYSDRFQRTSTLVDAETAYWMLSSARQMVMVSTDALARAKKIHEWSARRAQLHLADEADELQAAALVRVRELQLQSAKDDERTASRAFNLARNTDSDDVPESIPPPGGSVLKTLRLPAEMSSRDDVRAAEQQARATEASATIAREKDKPTLDIYGSYALNNEPGDSLWPAAGATFNSGLPTRAIGVRFSAPLNLSAASAARDGWSREQSAADLNYQKRLVDQTQGWKDLTQKFSEARRRLTLNESIEAAQLVKLNYEKERLKRGRTTTYQVLLFEEDFAQAQLSRIVAQRDILTLFAQTRLYGGYVQ